MHFVYISTSRFTSEPGVTQGQCKVVLTTIPWKNSTSSLGISPFWGRLSLQAINPASSRGRVNAWQGKPSGLMPNIQRIRYISIYELTEFLNNTLPHTYSRTTASHPHTNSSKCQKLQNQRKVSQRHWTLKIYSQASPWIKPLILSLTPCT